MLQISAMLKGKALLLEKEAWGHLTACLAGTKTFSLWNILEDLFEEWSDSEEEESPPSKKTCQEDEPSTSYRPSTSTPSSVPSFNMIILMKVRFFIWFRYKFGVFIKLWATTSQKSCLSVCFWLWLLSSQQSYWLYSCLQRASKYYVRLPPLWPSCMVHWCFGQTCLPSPLRASHVLWIKTGTHIACRIYRGSRGTGSVPTY